MQKKAPITQVNNKTDTMLCTHEKTDISEVHGDDDLLEGTHPMLEDFLTSDGVVMSTTNLIGWTFKP